MKNKQLKVLIAALTSAAVVFSGIIALVGANMMNISSIAKKNTADYTLTLNKDNGQLANGGSYSTTDTLDSSATTSDGNHIEINNYYCGVFSTGSYTDIYAQLKKSSGYLYNTDTLDKTNSIYPLTGISSITVTFTSSSSPTLYYGSTENPTTNSTSLTSGTKITAISGNNYFKIKAGSNVVYIDSIVIEYACGSVSPTPTPTLSSIAINDPNLSYTVGQTYTTSSLTATGTYSDTSTSTITGYEVVSSDFTFGSAFTSAGTYSFYITYSGISSNTLTITVVSGTVVDATAITVSPTTLSLIVGGTSTLTYSLVPANATNSLSWASSSATVASIDSTTNQVTALAVGTTRITATTNNSLSAYCDVTVSAAPTTDSYEIVKSTSDLVVGDYYVFACNTKAATAGNISSSVMTSLSSTFSSDNSEITSLDSSTLVMTLGGSTGAWTFTNSSSQLGATSAKNLAWGNGTTTWTIAIDSSYNATITNTTSSCGKLQYNSSSPRFTTYTSSQTSIQLYKKSSIPVYATSIALSSSSLDLGINETSALNVVYTPSNTNQKNVTWTSSNASIASVSSAGVVSGVAIGGPVTITASVATEGNPVTATCAVTVKNIAVTGVTLNETSATIATTETINLVATVAPANATNKAVTWSSSDTSIATVSSSGVVSGVAVGGPVSISAKTSDGNYTASCSITISAVQQDAWTIMIYMCGADLESDSGYATGDLTEILNVSNQPSNVNIIVEAGGASSWKSTYSSVIDSSYLNRFHANNGKYVKDSQITRASMGLTSTFQSFLEWGLTDYPAQRTMVIMWNHGGAMRGCCYDENYSDDNLLNSEVKSAVSGAYTSTGRTQKLEVIGYDACLMQVQDIAEFNSSYFNYMVASEESESGYGWDYDGGWIDSIYANPKTVATSTILTSMVDTFITENGGTSSSSNDQTLSWLDLSKMAAYKTAWENMASYMTSNVLSSSNKSTFQSLVKGCKYYAGTSYVAYSIVDAMDFLNKLESSSTFNTGSMQTYIDAAQLAFNNLIGYSSCGKGAGNSHGLCMFFSLGSSSSKSTYYTSTQTNFSNWRALNNTYGS